MLFLRKQTRKKREFDAEHFRPKTKVTEEDNHPGYWWLAYEWDNLLYACKPCNQQHKKNSFPLLNIGDRASSPEDDLSIERPLLINPIFDDPEEYISFEWWQAYGLYVKAIGLDADKENRGNVTINILGLNSPELLEERAEFTELFDEVETTMKVARREGNQHIIDEMVEKIKKLTSSNRRFAGFARAFFRASNLGQYVAND